jgi:uncharacterized protein YuzE
MPGLDRKLAQALPELVADLESALLHLGRGDLVAQLKNAALERWTYDEFADATYLVLQPTAMSERFSLFDELGVNLDTDDRGQLCGLEILSGRAIAERLEKAGV